MQQHGQQQHDQQQCGARSSGVSTSTVDSHRTLNQRPAGGDQDYDAPLCSAQQLSDESVDHSAQWYQETGRMHTADGDRASGDSRVCANMQSGEEVGR